MYQFNKCDSKERLLKCYKCPNLVDLIVSSCEWLDCDDCPKITKIEVPENCKHVLCTNITKLNVPKNCEWFDCSN